MRFAMRTITHLLLLCFLLVSGLNSIFSQARFSNARYADEYMGGIIHFRLKPEFQSVNLNNHPGLQQICSRYGASQPEKRFPNAQKPIKPTNEQGERLADLSLHYSIRFTSNTDPIELVDAIRKTGIASVVEPQFLPRLSYVPNDDSIGVQYALQKISAFAAWDISRGDTNTIVGITDTGIDPNHPDLSTNIARNWADPINGIDDDNDGFTDNFIGWDTGNNDNDPTSDGTFHGQHVTGLSSAVADNQVGIAGTGFNCRFIHVKIANSSGALSGAYEGLVYAAEHGCKIVNCSWGGSQYSELNAEIVRYVNVNLNCLVVCGSGNNNNSLPFYPAAYENAFSVGATTATDAKADFSNYGYSHDLFAPGEYVLSTWANNGYLVSGGTSMASPVVAGAAGILWSSFPELNSRQIAEKLKITADTIDQLPGNEAYANQLGAGRLNMFRALSETGVPAPTLHTIAMSDNAANQFLPEDTLFISGFITNYLFPANDVVMRVYCEDNYLQSLQTEIPLGAMATLANYSLEAMPLKFAISADCPVNQQALIRLEFTSDGKVRNQFLAVNLHADFVNLDWNNIRTSVGSYGLSGISGNGYIAGLGFQYRNNVDLLYECGLMLSRDAATVADVVRGQGAIDQEFTTENRIQPIPPFEGSVRQFGGSFTSTLGNLPLRVRQRAMADSANPNRNFVVLEYEFENLGNEVLGNLSAGLFADWDLINAGMNGFGTDAGNHAAWVKTLPVDSLYCGIAVLNTTQSTFYAGDNVPGGAGGINFYDGFSTDEKDFALRNNRLNTGAGDAGTDVLMIAAAEPFTLEPGTKHRVAFALLAGDNQEHFSEQAGFAQDFYLNQGLPLQTQDVKQSIVVFPNPASDYLTISGLSGDYTVSIFDTQGRKLKSLHQSNNAMLNIANLENGQYIISVVRGQSTQTFFVSVIR